MDGVDAIFPTVGVSTLSKGKSRHIGQAKGLIRAALPKNLIVFPTPVNGAWKGQIRIWLEYLTDTDWVVNPTVYELFLPTWDNDFDVLEGAYLGRKEIICGESTEVVGSGTVPVETDLGWLGFFHSATSICNLERYYEFPICRYDPETWKITAVTRQPMVTILDCPLTPEEIKQLCGFGSWVKNAVYIQSQKFDPILGEVQFPVCFRDCLLCDGHLPLEEIERELVEVDPDKPYVAESAIGSLT